MITRVSAVTGMYTSNRDLIDWLLREELSTYSMTSIYISSMLMCIPNWEPATAYLVAGMWESMTTTYRTNCRFP